MKVPLPDKGGPKTIKQTLSNSFKVWRLFFKELSLYSSGLKLEEDI